MAISRKFGSMMALLLMVAVLMASAASAQPLVTVANECNRPIVLDTKLVNVTIKANSNVTIPGTLGNLLTGPVTVTILGVPLPIVIPISLDLITLILNIVNSIRGVLVSVLLVIKCTPNNCITITVIVVAKVLGTVTIGPLSATVGPICKLL